MDIPYYLWLTPQPALGIWTSGIAIWQHCNECDNLSETILFRDFLGEILQP